MGSNTHILHYSGLSNVCDLSLLPQLRPSATMVVTKSTEAAVAAASTASRAGRVAIQAALTTFEGRLRAITTQGKKRMKVANDRQAESMLQLNGLIYGGLMTQDD